MKPTADLRIVNKPVMITLKLYPSDNANIDSFNWVSNDNIEQYKWVSITNIDYYNWMSYYNIEN